MDDTGFALLLHSIPRIQSSSAAAASINQSEISIHLSHPIRCEYLPVKTDP